MIEERAEMRQAGEGSSERSSDSLNSVTDDECSLKSAVMEDQERYDLCYTDTGT